MFLFFSNTSAFELDDLDAFFFDSESFKLNSHFLNVFANSQFNNTISKTDAQSKETNFDNINLKNFIKTQFLINRYIPFKDKTIINNPRKSSEWLFDIYLVYKIDEGFENNLPETNEDITIEKNSNGNSNSNNDIIDPSKLINLNILINDNNYFDFEKYENTDLNMINFNIIYGDPLDLNLRYAGATQYTKDQKLNQGQNNKLINGACFEITSLNLHLETLKRKNCIFINKH